MRGPISCQISFSLRSAHVRRTAPRLAVPSSSAFSPVDPATSFSPWSSRGWLVTARTSRRRTAPGRPGRIRRWRAGPATSCVPNRGGRPRTGPPRRRRRTDGCRRPSGTTGMRAPGLAPDTTPEDCGCRCLPVAVTLKLTASHELAVRPTRGNGALRCRVQPLAGNRGRMLRSDDHGARAAADGVVMRDGAHRSRRCCRECLPRRSPRGW